MAKTKKVSKVRRWRASAASDGDTRSGIIRVLKRGKRGHRYVSSKKRSQGLKNPWILAVALARKKLNIKGFHPIKKSGTHIDKNGKACSICVDFYETAATIYKSKKRAISQNT
jgi:hypothetical protein